MADASRLRAFVALTPPPSAVEDLRRAIAPLRGRSGEPRWIPPERWHVTLAFLGDVPVSRVDRLRTELATVPVGGQSLELALAAAGTFPRRGAPEVLWVGLDGDLDALDRLARAAGRAAHRAVRGERDRKRFSPHLTIGRWRPRDAADRNLVEDLAAYRGPVFRAERMFLLRSHLGPEPRYEQIDSWELG